MPMPLTFSRLMKTLRISGQKRQLKPVLEHKCEHQSVKMCQRHIDGATWHQKIRFIIIPHVNSLTLFILLFTIMDTYRVFDSVFVLSELNPVYKANTLMTYTFQTAITVQRMGKANAMAIITVIGILIVLIPNLRISYKEQLAER
jgi:ABC-type sugar transport system permease subunit